MTSTTALIRYDAACLALAEAKAVDEVKDIHDKAEAMRAYARQAKNPQLEADSWEIRRRAEDRLGVLSAALDKALVDGHTGKIRLPSSGKSKTEVLKEAGISTSAAHRYEQFSRLPPAEKEARIAKGRAAIEAGASAADKIIRGTQGTGDNEWYTPAEYVDLARGVLGGIDLDPASSEHAQITVKASAHFTLEHNGLEQKWPGRVWLNPPYAQPYIEQFADKMIEEIEAHHVTAAIMLTHNYTDTAWFQKLARSAAAICFTKGRIRFEAPNGDLASPTQGQAFFYFGKDHKSFVEAFRDVGIIVRPAQ